jgi:hypothetical protein
MTKSLNIKLTNFCCIKIGNEYQGFVMLYSEYILTYFVVRGSDHSAGNFRNKHFQHWLLFVQFIRTMVKPSTTIEEAKGAQELIKQFCKEFPSLYPGKFKPNTHYSLHVLQDALLTGNTNNTWNYSYERLI